MRSVLLGFEKEQFKVDWISRIDRMFEKKNAPNAAKRGQQKPVQQVLKQKVQQI